MVFSCRANSVWPRRKQMPNVPYEYRTKFVKSVLLLAWLHCTHYDNIALLFNLRFLIVGQRIYQNCNALKQRTILLRKRHFAMESSAQKVNIKVSYGQAARRSTRGGHASWVIFLNSRSPVVFPPPPRLIWLRVFFGKSRKQRNEKIFRSSVSPYYLRSPPAFRFLPVPLLAVARRLVWQKIRKR